MGVGSIRALQAGRGALRAGLVLAVALALLSVGPGATPAHAEEGLTVDGSTTYVVQPRQGKVHVSVTVDLANTMPATREGAYISTPYFDSFAVPALGPVRNVQARSSAGGSLDTSVEQGRMGISGVVVDLEPNLVHGAPQTVTIEYDLPNQPPRSRSVTRVNRGFASWFVFGAGDPGAIDIRLITPTDFDDVTVSNALELEEVREPERNVYTISNLRDEGQAAMFASATSENGIRGEQFSVGETDVTIKAWPQDATWGRFATRWTRRGLPVLSKLIGVEALQDDLTIAESSRSYQLGFAGFYVPSEGRVEVGDRLDKTTLLHELAHVWFNHHLFTDRWIGEGLAESYANRALKELGAKAQPPKRINIVDRGRVSLNAWPAISVLDPEREKIEAYAYNASYSVVDELIAEIGVDGMRDVLVAASERRLPYPGLPGAEEETLRERNWQYFYDLLETVGGSEDAEDILRDEVLIPREEALLPQRAALQRKLDDLQDGGEGWVAPLEVRESLTAWQFGSTKGLLQRATDLRDRSLATVEQLASVDIDIAESLEEQYAGAKFLQDYNESLTQLESTTEDVVALHDRADAAGPVAALGLVGSDLGLEDIDKAMTDGELDGVPDMVAAASAQLDQAPTRGAVILGAIALVLLLIALVVWLRRRRRRLALAAAAPDDADAEVAGPPVSAEPDDVIVVDEDADPQNPQRV